MLERYRNRTISEADADQLHPGLRRFAKLHGWKVAPEVAADDPTRITLRDLAQGAGQDLDDDEDLDDDDDDGPA